MKVGPALTFAQREAMFSLSLIEEELLKGVEDVGLSGFISTLERVMNENPANCFSVLSRFTL